jgi:hypothetical protein
VGGADQAKFSITSGGVLSFNTAPDYETPTDANVDNVYEVTVQADDDSGGSATQAVSVTVTPVMASYGQGVCRVVLLLNEPVRAIMVRTWQDSPSRPGLRYATMRWWPGWPLSTARGALRAAARGRHPAGRRNNT